MTHGAEYCMGTRALASEILNTVRTSDFAQYPDFSRTWAS
jgi:hypothetical protein